MDQERWQLVDRMLEAVLQRTTAAERSAFLDEQCANDEGLRSQVELLVAAHDRQDDFLEQPWRAPGIALLGEDASILTGQTLGSYRIIRPLGFGGAGEVYLAEDMRLARPVALKLLARCRAADREYVRRFRREASAASALNHPNILTIYEIGEYNGRDMIASEYVEGVTLREYVRSGRLPIAGALDIALQIGAALKAAHAAGIVHRDIKPENVMVRPDGLVKVLDFGIAKQTRFEGPTAAGDQLTTAAGLVMGTAAYMSPEQARGHDVDERTDLWSLGVIVYEMLAGRLPFAGETASDRIAGILECQPQPLADVRSDVPPELDRIVLGALAKNREERCQDAASLVRDLDRVRRKLSEQRSFTWRLGSHRRVRVALFALLLGAGIPLAIWGIWEGARIYRHSAIAPSRETISSVAVLPFANVGGSSETEYLSDGMTDTLINDLSQIAQLKVISRSSVFRYKGREIDARKAGDALGVRAVLTGRVAERGGDVSVTVELTDARDNSHIWGEQYRRKLTNILDVQEDIAHDIAEKLRLRLSKDERDRLARRHTTSPEAYQAYLKGRFYWFKWAHPSWLPGSAPDFSKSRDYYLRAIEADPAYALAYAGLGHYYAMAGGNALMRPDDAWPKAERAFQKALELDPDVPDGRTGIAVLKWMYYRDWHGAEEQLRSAIRLSPQSRPEPPYARLLAAEGRFDEAIAQIRRAVDLDPLSIRYSSGLGMIYCYAGRYDDCIREYHQALELTPGDVSVHEALGYAYERKGLYPEAIAEWRAALRLGGDPGMAATLDRVYTQNGFVPAVRAFASNRLQRLNALARQGQFAPAFEYARAHLMLGHKQEALQWLTRACDERTVPVLFIKVDSFFDQLHEYPSFQELVKRIGVPN